VANVVVSALATWNGKALKKAKQDVNVFDKQLKSLARTLGFTFSATAIVAFSKKAVKAFAEDEASAKSLQIQLENTGNAFRVTEVEAYIKSLEKTYAILTDLRGPFQTLLNVTGSVDLAQRSLEAALDISAGTTQSLTTVVAAISAGVRGQTKGIKSLNSGIDENILATGDMNKIMEELEKRFAGQAAARLDTYAGKMDALKKSTGEATKIIGEGLIDALDILSEDETVTDLSEAMENFAENTAAATKAIAKLAKGFNDFTSSPSFKPAILAFTLLYARKSGNFNSFKAALVYVGASGAIELATNNFGRGSSQFGGTRQLSKDLMMAKLLGKARKKEYDIIVKKNNIENKNLEELKKKFDLERIGLTAALNQATDDETKLRLKAQLAILDEDEAMAKKLLAEMEAADALKKLAEQAKLAGLSLMDFALVSVRSLVSRINTQIEKINKEFGLPSATGDTGPFMPPATTPYDPLSSLTVTSQDLADTGFRYDPLSGLRPTAQDIRITVDTSGSGDKLSQAIAESIQIATRSGYSTSPAGSL
jgi:post-segregation antitoxin (ccd killing protein)